jgi:hypothetical protein
MVVVHAHFLDALIFGAKKSVPFTPFPSRRANRKEQVLQ